MKKYTISTNSKTDEINKIARAIDTFAEKMIIMMPGHKQDILQIAEIIKKEHKENIK